MRHVGRTPHHDAVWAELGMLHTTHYLNLCSNVYSIDVCKTDPLGGVFVPQS